MPPIPGWARTASKNSASVLGWMPSALTGQSHGFDEREQGEETKGKRTPELPKTVTIHCKIRLDYLNQRL